MCLLTYYPRGVQPDVDALHNGAEFNNHGHGFAIVARDHIVVRRGMNADKTINKFKRLRAMIPDGPALFHSRFSTHGVRGRTNCHPFPVARDQRTVVGHNGILPVTMQPAKGDRRSDTRIAADEVFGFEPFADLDSEESRELLGHVITPANKLVFLTVNPCYRKNAYLINERSGEWDGDIWYSNDDYSGRSSRYVMRLVDDRDYSGYSSTEFDDAPILVCCWCGEETVSGTTGYCWTCGICNDCGQYDEHCQCYAPSLLRDGEYETQWTAL